jgi:hypothetical protein
MSGSYDFKSSRLWRTSLAERANDEHWQDRGRLRSSLLRMRDRVQPLVGTIQQDCPGLTVHDITHLDALWEMGDLISGKDFELTPAEAFVFGAAVLLHDAGMAALGYPGGRQGITETMEWKDSFATFLQKKHGRSPSEEEKNNPDRALSDQALFEVLRRLHAQRAEALAMRPIRRHEEAEFFLIEDSDLRESYGEAIGRIAHSHHWSVAELPFRLQGPTGAAAILPSAWSVDELKVACLLRCADISHVDQRRAPSMLYALLQPSGYSNLHWSFQNKLRKPIQIEEALRYTAGNSFSRVEADAWWLCFEAITLIDKELSDVDALLLETDRQRFAVRGVRGADHPRLLAQDIKTNGWQPVAATLNASNPIKLAQTLGGENLYGPKSFAPIRELLQNAVDAVRARRILEKREKHWGYIRLTIKKNETESEKGVWLHFDDNGVGMSQRTLSQTLLDFGRSLWTSSEVQEELPGLAHGGFRAIGKFGIGFFSVFLLGQKVKVISRKYNVAAGTVQVLEFDSISRRPIIRDAHEDELPLDFSTRISVRLDSDLVFGEVHEFHEFEDFVLEAAVREGAKNATGNECGIGIKNAKFFAKKVMSLMSCVDIQFDLSDSCNSISFRHDPDWINQDSSSFLRELYADLPDKNIDFLVDDNAHRLTVVRDKTGSAVGRAAITWPRGRSVDSADEHFKAARISVGGIVYSADRFSTLPAVGVFPGDTQYAARHQAKAFKDELDLSLWASEQARLFREENVLFSRKIPVARALHVLGGDVSGLPICYLGGKLADLSDLRTFLASEKEVLIPLDEMDFDETISVMSLRGISLQFFLNKVKSQVGVFDVNYSGQKFSEEEFLQARTDSSGLISLESLLGDGVVSSFRRFSFKDDLIQDEFRTAWGASLSFEIQRAELFDPPMRDMPKGWWVVRVSRNQG